MNAVDPICVGTFFFFFFFFFDLVVIAKLPIAACRCLLVSITLFPPLTADPENASGGLEASLDLHRRNVKHIRSPGHGHVERDSS